MEIVITIIFSLGVIVCAWLALRSPRIFKEGHNPFERICKKCNSHQHLYTYYGVMGNYNQWQSVYPIGNDPKCKCHKYASPDK